MHFKSVNRELKAVEGVRVMVQTRKFRNYNFLMTTHLEYVVDTCLPNEKA